ncbi:MAG: pyruvate:ferredoxin (flavodoxin) oxidoreductase [Acidobacteria bacterium]|nr:pyruvate:ferredoxin (flavodoxin) oxidoreductase [Acidobacteriota bacterium]
MSVKNISADAAESSCTRAGFPAGGLLQAEYRPILPQHTDCRRLGVAPARITVDGNDACAAVAYQLSDVIAIYPITPSSGMAEAADAWAAARRPNLWGSVPAVVQMQSEGGAAGTVHGALQAGGLATTFTASQGLLLMIPNMFKIAGELTPAVFHVSARAVATHALSIFGDHSDVMAARATGFALLSSASVQEAQDLAAVAHAATLESRLPFLHFFDGFRTSHELTGITPLDADSLRSLVDNRLVDLHRMRALSPDRPVVRGTAQNPDVFFQGREAVNRYYDAAPAIVQSVMDRFGALTGRRHRLFEYDGAPDAERVIVIMGSGAEAVRATVRALGTAAKVGVLTVKLFRPFSAADFVAALPPEVRAIAVLDRTKEPGAIGEPLYQDVVTAIAEHRSGARFVGPDGPRDPIVIGGRYGLGSKEFTPAMAKAVFDALDRPSPARRFTVGITDDVTRLSLGVDETFVVEPPGSTRAVFFGLGADGTVGANRNTIAILGEETGRWAQGYFVYDSKKSGAVTISHLRFGPHPTEAPYLIRSASFVACHQHGLLERLDVLRYAEPGGVFLLNAPAGPDGVWTGLSFEVQQQIVDKRLRVFAIDAYAVARSCGMGARINTIMQTCFFAISGVLPREEAVARIKQAIEKTYGRRGAAIVRRNFEAVDAALSHLFEVPVPPAAAASRHTPPAVDGNAPDFVRHVTAAMLANQGDRLPVSAFPVDGAWPTGTSKWEKRNIAAEIPVWEPALCIQCNKCALVCPHAAIRVKVFDDDALGEAPASFKHMQFKGPGLSGEYSVQVAPEDCTGCELCVMVCPGKDRADPARRSLAMAPQGALRALERANFAFFLGLPEVDRTRLGTDVKSSQFLEPLFEYSGACAGCGETPYIKLLTQLVGDRLVIANATGCSSIYGGNLPTTPYTTNADGRGPAWSNSLFEDNAEFGYGLRLAIDQHEAHARRLLQQLAAAVEPELATALLDSPQRTESDLRTQRDRIVELRQRLAGLSGEGAAELHRLADYLVKKSVWIVGGDGWAYDIGFGGLDHVLASGARVRVLVLDTEVYSNTGGQQSKATPIGAAAKFAVAGKERGKKDLGLMAMAYGHVYVAQVAFGARDAQTLQAFQEAESYPGPALIIAFSPCIAHGYEMSQSLAHQRLAADTGYWPLYRFDPRREAQGKAALVLDSPPPRADVSTLMAIEARFDDVGRQNQDRHAALIDRARQQIASRMALYRELAARAAPLEHLADSFPSRGRS